MDIIECIKKDLKENLSDYRYEHSIRVAEEAKKLAKFYNTDEESAYLAGLIHDIAKEFTNEENKTWITKYNLSDKLLNEKIIHAEIGAIVAKEKYHLSDNICNAIKYHTIGDINMSLLDKIVFIADKIESGKKYPGIEEERILAYQNIDKALELCLDNQRKKLASEGKALHHKTLELLDFLNKN